jgi:hypothetical protein
MAGGEKSRKEKTKTSPSILDAPAGFDGCDSFVQEREPVFLAEYLPTGAEERGIPRKPAIRIESHSIALHLEPDRPAPPATRHAGGLLAGQLLAQFRRPGALATKDSCAPQRVSQLSDSDFAWLSQVESKGEGERMIASVEKILRQTGVLKALSRAKWLT